ncbi:hypothetical protein AA313_de0205759 [Arthrobotrys entomopaga]|nr:hypothetical protein AA313_de0205759 [Arthrobotrys entomopaga]
MVQTRSQTTQAAATSAVPAPETVQETVQEKAQETAPPLEPDPETDTDTETETEPASPMKVTTPPPQPPPETPRSQKQIYKEAHSPHGSKSIIAQRLWNSCSLATPPRPFLGGKRYRESTSPSEMVASSREHEQKRAKTTPDMIGLGAFLTRPINFDYPGDKAHGVKPMKSLLPAFGKPEDPEYDANKEEFENALSTTVETDKPPTTPRSILKKNRQEIKPPGKNRETSSIEANLLTAKLQASYQALAGPNGETEPNISGIRQDIKHNIKWATMGHLSAAMARVEASDLAVKSRLFNMILWQFAVKVKQGTPIE